MPGYRLQFGVSRQIPQNFVIVDLPVAVTVAVLAQGISQRDVRWNIAVRISRIDAPFVAVQSDVIQHTGIGQPILFRV